MIAKRLDSKYQPDRRSDDWLKLPLKPAQHCVIGAYRLDGQSLDLLLVALSRGLCAFVGLTGGGDPSCSGAPRIGCFGAVVDVLSECKFGFPIFDSLVYLGCHAINYRDYAQLCQM